MIHLITRESIGILPLASAGLSRGLSIGNLGKLWSIPKLADHLINYSVYGFYQEESKYSGVFSIVETPLEKVLYFFWSGREETGVPVDYQEVDKFLVEVAMCFGCRYIQLEGRKGWKPIVESLGYSLDSYSFIKELSYESLPNP